MTSQEDPGLDDGDLLYAAKGGLWFRRGIERYKVISPFAKLFVTTGAIWAEVKSSKWRPVPADAATFAVKEAFGGDREQIVRLSVRRLFWVKGLLVEYRVSGEETSFTFWPRDVRRLLAALSQGAMPSTLKGPWVTSFSGPDHRRIDLRRSSDLATLPETLCLPPGLG